jgi:hypothetical protein
VAVLDTLVLKQACQRSLIVFARKAQVALLRFEHVDFQYIPRCDRLPGAML